MFGREEATREEAEASGTAADEAEKTQAEETRTTDYGSATMSPGSVKESQGSA